MLRKITVLCISLLLAIPAFASGHQLEALGALFGFFLMVIGGFAFLTLAVNVINYYKNLKILQAISTLLTSVALVGAIYLLVTLPSFLTFLLLAVPAFCAYLLWKRNQKGAPVTVRYSGNFLLKMMSLYTIIQVAIVFITRDIYGNMDVSSIQFYGSLIQICTLAINLSIILWSVQKMLLNDVAAGKKITILNGIAYAVLLSVASTVVLTLIAFTGLWGMAVGGFNHYFWSHVLLSLFYMAAAGCIGYFFASAKKVDMMTDDMPAEDQDLP